MQCLRSGGFRDKFDTELQCESLQKRTQPFTPARVSFSDIVILVRYFLLHRLLFLSCWRTADPASDNQRDLQPTLKLCFVGFHRLATRCGNSFFRWLHCYTPGMCAHLHAQPVSAGGQSYARLHPTPPQSQAQTTPHDHVVAISCTVACWWRLLHWPPRPGCNAVVCTLREHRHCWMVLHGNPHLHRQSLVSTMTFGYVTVRTC